MKANELQIGDYVNYRGQIIKVTSLYDKGNSNEIGWTDKDCVWVNGRCMEPITITPEILEKNGFIKDSGEDKRVGVQYHLVVPTGFEEKSFTIQVNLYKKPICGVSTLVKYWGRIPPHNGGMNDIHLCIWKDIIKMMTIGWLIIGFIQNKDIM